MLKLGKRQVGVSLVESLIALLVISIGLLGIAALQITSVQQNSSAANHSQAVWMAYEMSDRIRANSNPDNDRFDDYAGIDTTAITTQACLATACSEQQMIDADATDWANLVSNLPAGRGRVEDNAPDGLLIKVMWDDSGTGATGTGCGPDPGTDLTCYTVVITEPTDPS